MSFRLTSTEKLWFPSFTLTVLTNIDANLVRSVGIEYDKFGRSSPPADTADDAIKTYYMIHWRALHVAI